MSEHSHNIASIKLLEIYEAVKETPELRKLVIASLGSNGSDTAVARLVQIYDTATDPQTKVAVIKALGDVS